MMMFMSDIFILSNNVLTRSSKRLYNRYRSRMGIYKGKRGKFEDSKPIHFYTLMYNQTPTFEFFDKLDIEYKNLNNINQILNDYSYSRYLRKNQLIRYLKI